MQLRMVVRWLGPSVLALLVVLAALVGYTRWQHTAVDEKNLHQIVEWIQNGQIVVNPPPTPPVLAPPAPAPNPSPPAK